MKISRALISVSDKTGVVNFARRLHEMGIEILSTGGTAKLLQEEQVPVVEVADYTGLPEMLDGRVKTLHPKIHGGLLFLRENERHVQQTQEHGILPISLVAVNLYPFAETVAKEGVTLEKAIEQIDIGGPAMLRSAAKNFQYVAAVCDPADYEAVLDELEEHHGQTTRKLRERLAIKVFCITSGYDSAIADYLNQEQETSSSFSLSLPLAAKLRYGENPHQEASLFGSFNDHFQKLQGKELSFNNILDISSAVDLIGDFEEPTVAILKHTNPCGVGSDDDLKTAWAKAFATDKQAPFGGVIICNRPLTEGLARSISEIFSEVIIAPDFEPAARSLLQKKKNLRLMKYLGGRERDREDIRSVIGGVLVQQRDLKSFENIENNVVTKRPPTKEETRALLFGWRVVKHVKSNAIVYAGPDRTLGIGAGQMSRVDSSRIAVRKAGEAGLSLNGSAIASDAFFPFPDGLLAAAEAGATAAIQPGGSVRDEAVISAADEHDMAMAFTGVRHFRH